MNNTIKRNHTEVEFLKELIGETEMVRNYAPEVVLDSIENMCQQRYKSIESQCMEDKIKTKMKELIDLVPDDGYLSITGFDDNELSVYKSEGAGTYSQITKVCNKKVQG